VVVILQELFLEEKFSFIQIILGLILVFVFLFVVIRMLITENNAK
jgi:hypothetical protein